MPADSEPTSRPLRFPEDVSTWSTELEALARRINEGTREAMSRRESETTAESDRHASRVSEIVAESDQAISAANDALDRAVAELGRQHQEARAEAEGAIMIDRDRILREAIDHQNAAKAAIEEATWLAETVFEANEDRPRLEFEEARAELVTIREDFDELERRMRRKSRRYLQPRPKRPTPPTSLPADPETTLRLELATAREVVERFRRIPIAILYRGPIFVPPLLATIGAGVGVGWILQGSDRAMQIGGVVGFAVFLVIYLVGYVFATKAVRAGWRAFHRSEGLIQLAFQSAENAAEDRRGEAEKALARTRDRELVDAEQKFKPRIGDAKKKALERIQKLEGSMPERLAEIDRDFDAQLTDARNRSTTASEAAEQARDRQQAEEQRLHAETSEDILKASKALLGNERRTWMGDAPRLDDALQRAIVAMEERFPPLDGSLVEAWRPGASSPPGIRFGHLDFRRTALEADVRKALDIDPEDRLDYRLPAAIGLPSRASLCVVVDEQSRESGLDTLRTLILRLLLSIPPGKVQFTLLDPVGLGENFAGFMHLEDERPGLVGERIWTERGQVEQRLVNLTETMETVIQKYLRNEFESIEAYNEVAGEIAEPYRFLVVSDFPNGFSEEATRRLTSVLRSGPRCGVFTLLLRNGKTPLPEEFDESILTETMLTLRLGEETAVFDVPGLAELPLRLDPPPPDAALIELVRKVGRAAADAGRVEVPFETIAPASEEDFWSRDSTDEIRIPLGRSGASRLQDLVLGRGTAQHALIAGKTGSGKSTLLHALITNLACWYSPDELEFYLVDFKKGVEFKTYATHHLPHARAVAVESDREFGLSVLKGLDEELAQRGERYRAAEVQDLAGWRRKRPEEAMPRVLLVIDEFQELFVTDDQIAQEASLLLDRLVRQGRAFGMHVILGSQTLGGAYSLNRTTMGQMGVRIALACNEQDSMLILSDDNVAARLLARPGEAIYNDQGGLIEGNSPFQVCWLPDQVREAYLGRVGDLAERRPIADRPPQLVFEGNAPAHLGQSRPIVERVEVRPDPNPTQIPLWLGEAVAIAPATNAVLRRQAGANLVAVGQQSDPLMATSVATLISIALAHRAGDVRITLLDGTPADDPNAGLLERIAAALPHEIDRVSFRDAADAITELGTELARRTEDDAERGGNRVLLIHGLQRFRVLRRAEDDFGFSDSDAPPTPDKTFGTLLREGPEHGLWVTATVDTVQSLERVVDRFSMRSFDQRALFQQSATDSSTLVDSTVASDLGPNRAILYSDERGTIEKYRPWSLPSEAFLADLGAKLTRRES